MLTEQGNIELQLLSLLGARLAGFLVFAPVIDGSFLAVDPTIGGAAERPRPADLMGTNAADGTMFVAEIVSLLGGTLKESEYITVLTLLFGAENTAEIVALYGSDPTGDNSAYLSSIATDYLFGCANRYVARSARSEIWVYRFDETSLNVWPDVRRATTRRATPTTSRSPSTSTARSAGTFTPAQAQLSNEMIGYWTSFAERLDPNGDGRLAWPFFTPQGSTTCCSTRRCRPR